MGRTFCLCSCNLSWCSKVFKNSWFQVLILGGEGWRRPSPTFFKFENVCCHSLIGWFTRVVHLFRFFIIYLLYRVSVSQLGHWPSGWGARFSHDPKVRGSNLWSAPWPLFFPFMLFYFSLLIYFLTPYFLLFWQNVEHQSPVFLPLEFNGSLIFFIWAISFGLMRSWSEGLVKTT